MTFHLFYNQKFRINLYNILMFWIQTLSQNHKISRRNLSQEMIFFSTLLWVFEKRHCYVQQQKITHIFVILRFFKIKDIKYHQNFPNHVPYKIVSKKTEQFLEQLLSDVLLSYIFTGHEKMENFEFKVHSSVTAYEHTFFSHQTSKNHFSLFFF